MALELHIKIVAKLLVPPLESFFGLRFTHVQDQVWNFSFQSAGGGNQVAFVFFNKLFIDPRIDAIVALDIGKGAKLGQVVVTVFIFGQQYLVETLIGTIFGKF